MKECRYRKRIQIYLDGWMDDKEAGRLEDHLRRCSDCQTEMVELEEVASAALEIVDQAPDLNYWANFPARVFNRILSRDVNPYEGKRRSAKSLRLKIGSYSVAITALAAAILLIFNYANRSPVVPDTGVREGVENHGPIAAEDIAESIIFTEEGSGELPVAKESQNIPEGQQSAPAEEEPLVTAGLSPVAGNEIEEDESQSSLAVSELQSDYDLGAVFRKPALFERAPLKLDDDYNFLDRLMAAYRRKPAADYRISQAVVAEGILSGYSFRDINGLDNGNYGSLDMGLIPGLTGSGYSRGWGYLSIPDDTSNSEELRKYLIELELMQAK